MSIDEASDLYQQFYKEPKMGKTVTVEVELPDGWELAEPKARHVKPGEYYLLGGELQMWPSRSGISATPFPILRPIPDEKTWERPKWLHGVVAYITHDYVNRWRGWERKPEGFADGYWNGTDFHRMNVVNPNILPACESCQPAARIWRIVEPTK